MTEKQRHPGPSDTYVDVIPSHVWIKSICSGTIWKDTSVDRPVTSSLTVSTNHQLQSSHRSWSRDSSLTVVLGWDHIGLGNSGLVLRCTKSVSAQIWSCWVRVPDKDPDLTGYGFRLCAPERAGQGGTEGSENTLAGRQTGKEAIHKQ